MRKEARARKFAVKWAGEVDRVKVFTGRIEREGVQTWQRTVSATRTSSASERAADRVV